MDSKAQLQLQGHHFRLEKRLFCQRYPHILIFLKLRHLPEWGVSFHLSHLLDTPNNYKEIMDPIAGLPFQIGDMSILRALT